MPADNLKLTGLYEAAVRDIEKGNDNWKEIEDKMLKWALER